MTALRPDETPGTDLLDPPSPPVVHVPSSWVFPTLGPELFEALRSRGHRRIALQVPAGLVRNAHELAQRMREETGASVSLVARACFGACDFPSEGEVPGADALVVLGHSPIPNVRLTMPTYFVEMRQEGGEPEALAKTLVAAGVPARLGLVASVQHLDLLPRLTLALQAHGITLQTGTGDHRLSYPSQALGCNYTSAQSISATVDAYLFVGTGRFHPVGLAYAVGKPVWSLDPLQNRLEPPIDRASLVRDRQLLVARAMDARTFGIIVSSFSGQNRSAMAAALVDRARRAGRSAEILVADRVDPRDLEGRNLDAYVCTACPRIALDDYRLYPKPMLTPPEFLMALGELPMEPYRFDTYH